MNRTDSDGKKLYYLLITGLNFLDAFYFFSKVILLFLNNYNGYYKITQCNKLTILLKKVQKKSIEYDSFILFKKYKIIRKVCFRITKLVDMVVVDR